jgi:hypothetical protein
MNTYSIPCTKCNKPIPYQLYNTSELVDCPSCSVPLQVEVFPALLKEREKGQSGENIIIENESSCFYHPKKRAVVPCAECGRFLCSLCDIEFNERHLCPQCIEVGKSKRKMKNLETNRVLYDNIALTLAILPIFLFVWPTIITAPISLFVAIRYWRSPLSIIPRTKVRFIMAIGISGLQITGWALLFVKLLAKIGFKI